MLKKIPVPRVIMGMYIHELCGSWMDHPFWKSGFLLQDPHDLERLQASSVTEVWIDVSRGLDDVEGETPEQAVERGERVLQEIATQPVRENIADELRRAAKICERSKDAVVSMFNEVRMGQMLNTEQTQRVVSEITQSVLRHPNALLSIVRVKQADEYTYMHSVAVSALMIALARQMGFENDEVHEAGMAGLLHDVGKMAIDDGILNKPGSLTDNEFEQIKRHPEYGVRYLQKGSEPVSRAVLEACYSHHEKMDGSGYPRGLKADQISILSRMAAVCDVYDALTSDRPYKKGWGPSETIQRMAQWTGHFDPQIFQAFVRSVGIYPLGSLVRLKSGRLAVVIEQNEKSLLVPRVKVFFSTKSGLHIEREIVNLAAPHCNDAIAAREPREAWDFKDLDDLWREQ
ncbi:MAG: HD-GYP domain-containing protein [Gammaproteobacteria bacterium]|nr:HD-GYP domain-containing protein [Gammaproteobacteria bacterium]